MTEVRIFKRACVAKSLVRDISYREMFITAICVSTGSSETKSGNNTAAHTSRSCVQKDVG